MKKADRSDEEQHRQIVSRPDDEGLFQFLAEQFRLSPNDAPPGQVKSGTDNVCERIVLRSTFNVGGHNESVGPVIYSEDFKPTTGQVLKTEAIVQLSNRLLEKAQRDCAAAGRKMRYTVQSWSSAKASEPVGRYLLALSPRPGVKELQVLPEGDDEMGGDSVLSTKLLLGLLESERRDKRWMLEQSMNVISGALERDAERIERMEVIVDGTWKKQSELMAATEAMLSTASGREAKQAWRRWRQEKLDLLIEKGLGIAGVAIPQLLGAAVAQGAGGENPARAFLASVTDEQGVAAFGHVDHDDGSASGGIFTPEQFQMLLKIAGDPVPDDALVGQLASTITGEQVQQAQEVFATAQLLPLVSWIQARHSALQAAVQ